MPTEPMIAIKVSTMKLAIQQIRAYQEGWVAVATLIRVAADGLKECGEIRMSLELQTAFLVINDRLPDGEERKELDHGRTGN